MTRIDIVGLTLAEIALALLFCFIAAFAPAYARLGREAKDPSLRLKVQELQAENDRLKLDNDSLKLENDSLKRQLEGFTRGARSKQTPSCTEIGKADGPLFTTTIREDRYDLDGAIVTFQKLRTHFAEVLSDAKGNQCVQTIRVYYGPEISVQEYDSALRRIEQLFYATKLGQLPR